MSNEKLLRETIEVLRDENEGLEHRLREAEKDAERYRLLRRGQHWSTVDGIGDTLRGEALDRAVDAVMQPPKGE